jgi:hypothetical protein
MTKYWHPNASDSDMETAWDAIDTNAMAIALDEKFIERVGLPSSTPFPWDTERSVYYIKGIHDLHCLVSPTSHFKCYKLTFSETCSQGDCIETQRQRSAFQSTTHLPLPRYVTTRRHVCSR